MVTPDRFPGIREDEGIALTDEGADPANVGEIVLNAGAIKAKDATGVFDIRSGTGLSEAQHEALDRLTHNINETSFDEILRTGNRVDSVTTYETAAKLKKIREELFTYTGNQVTQIITIQYDAAGVEKERNTEVLVYTGNNLDTVTRTHV